MKNYSKLLINGKKLLVGSDWNVSVDIQPIAGASNMRRTINGEMISLARSVFRKYRVSISGSGRRAPEISHMMPGDHVQITAPEPIFTNGADFGRVIVERVGVKATGGQIAVGPGDYFPVPVVGVGVRPVFECMITGVSVGYDERTKDYNWRLEAEER